MSKSQSMFDYKKMNIKNSNLDFMQEEIENKYVTQEVLKFHYRTMNRIKNNVVNYKNPADIYSWSSTVEGKDILPDFYEEIIKLDIKKHKQIHSCLQFNKEYFIDVDDLGNILFDAFGREAPYSSKKYPSAGALYPVIPLVIILEESNSDITPGCYVFDSTEVRLFRITNWTKDNVNEVKELLNYNKCSLPPHCIAYALDFRRALTKYNEKGYRHALIEVGLMAQSFRQSLQNFESLRDRCWSDFVDLPLTSLCGLNIRLCPITLIQWFGYSE